MKKNPDIFNEDLDIDDLDISSLLKPRADFRTSSGFKQKLMEEAKAMPRRRPRRRIPFIAASAAAAVAALAILSVFLFRESDVSNENRAVTVSGQKQIQTPTDTLYKEITSPLTAEASQPKQDNSPIRKSIPSKRQESKAIISSESFARKEKEGIKIQPVTEGEMPMASNDRDLDPDEVRSRLLESRRNAELAYIDMMRAEIEANKAYITQFMTDEYILNSNTSIIETSF